MLFLWLVFVVVCSMELTSLCFPGDNDVGASWAVASTPISVITKARQNGTILHICIAVYKRV